MVEKVADPGTFLQNLYENTNEIRRNEVFLRDGRVLYRYTYPIFNFGTYIGPQ
jgi:hypothetical protein